jgi:hypothetical protein
MKSCRLNANAIGSLGLLIVTVVAAAGLAPAERLGVLSLLKVGMPVTLKETVGGRFEIGIIDGVPGPLGHEVVEVAADHVVVRDITGVVETWIPIYSLACVRRTNARP